MTFRASNTMT